MRDTYITDEGVRDHPAAGIETVVADPGDIIETFSRNADEESRRNTHVLRIEPPFEEEASAEPYLEEGPKRYPPDIDPEPLHLSPGTFVENDDGAHPGETHLSVPTLAEARTVAREDHGDDPDESAVESVHERLTDEWKTAVRERLTDRIRIFFDPVTADEIWADARYEE